jgi:DNA-binding response OmpR family regulator
MMLDETTAAPMHEPVTASPPPRHGAAAPPSRPPSALVLFVGAPCRPAAALCETLIREGMRSLWLAGVEQALAASRMACFDAVVLDAALLEGRDGATLSRLRAAMQCPIVMLAEHADEIDEILALELGADAYLLRPVAPRRLRAHLAVLMRLQQRAAPVAEGLAAMPADGDPRCWQLDRVGNRLRRGERCIELTDVQAALLQCLIEAGGRIVPRDRLAASLPRGRTAHPRSVDVYVHRLRKRLQAAGAFELSIEAIRGRGYVLEPETA